MEQTPSPRLQNLTLRRKSTQFKSPLIKRNEPIKSQNAEQLRQEVVELEKQLKDANKEISELKNMGMKQEELQLHIEKLHDYNEMKDIGQMLLGRIAILENVCTKDLYERYGLDLED